jgi:hypothetical protein
MLQLLPRFDSPRRFNLLPTYLESRRLIFANAKTILMARATLRGRCTQIKACYHLDRSQRPTVFNSVSKRESGADAQIGGGMRVGDAFPAMVGLQLIAI